MNNKISFITNKYPFDFFSLFKIIPFDEYKKMVGSIKLYQSLIYESNQICSSKRDLSRFLDNQYGSHLSEDITIIGDLVYLSYDVMVVDPTYIGNDINPLKNIINFLKTALSNEPLFNKNVFEIRKKEFILSCLRSDKKPQTIASNKIIELINQNVPATFNSLKKEYYENVTVDDLINVHNYLKKLPFVISYQGNNLFNQKELIESIEPSCFSLPIKKEIGYKFYRELKGEENFDSPTTIIKYALCFNKKYSTKNFVLMKILNIILGGDNSILFNEIREKKGYCYAINSRLYFDNKLILITTSVSKENYQKTIDTIDDILKNINSYLDEEILNRAKTIYQNVLNSLDDSGFDNYISRTFSYFRRGKDFDKDEIIKAILTITLDDIKENFINLRKIAVYSVIGVNKDVK